MVPDFQLQELLVFHIVSPSIIYLFRSHYAPYLICTGLVSVFGVITIWSVSEDTVCRSWRRSFLRVILILAIALYQLCINLFDRRIISDKIFNSEKGKISVNVLQIAATHPVAPQQACFVLVQLCWKCLRSLIWRTPLGYSFGCLFCKQPLIMKSFDFIERASDLWSDA